MTTIAPIKSGSGQPSSPGWGGRGLRGRHDLRRDPGCHRCAPPRPGAAAVGGHPVGAGRRRDGC